jgi:integrase
LRRHQLPQTEDRLLVGSDWSDLDLIFATATGGPLHPRNVVRSFDQAVVRADVPRIRIHDLRHTAATFALPEGVHPKLVQEMLGHAKVAITLDLYSHATDEMHQDAARRIGRALLGAMDDVAATSP